MKSRYAGCRYNGKRMRLHVAVWLEANRMEVLPEGFVVHHINMDTTDNRIENLVCMSAAEHSRLHASINKCKIRRDRKGRFA